MGEQIIIRVLKFGTWRLTAVLRFSSHSSCIRNIILQMQRLNQNITISKELVIILHPLVWTAIIVDYYPLKDFQH
jgi:hypothetical protein